jgi:hypothetical protein
MICQFPHTEPLHTDIQSPVPPWASLEKLLLTDFMPAPVKDLSSDMCIATFKDLQSKNYKYFVEIYTDGSVFTDVNSTSAAMVIKKSNTTIFKNWKLPSLMSIVSAELFAIYKALKYIKEKNL